MTMNAVTEAYHDAKKKNTLADLPSDLAPYSVQVFQLIDSVFSEAALPGIEDDRKAKFNPTNKNLEKAEFKALWDRINQKAAYTVHFDSNELIKKSVNALDKELWVAKLQYTIQKGEQLNSVSYESIKAGQGFELKENQTDEFSHSIYSEVKYDLIGKLAADTLLTRRTIAEILSKITEAVSTGTESIPKISFLKREP